MKNAWLGNRGCMQVDERICNVTHDAQPMLPRERRGALEAEQSQPLRARFGGN